VNLRPKVSVVIPTRNRAGFLARALRSVLAQRDADLEVIVVDDASSDGTSRLVRSVNDERVRLVSLTERHGEGGARNAGIAQARGRWVAFVDDDDLWAPDKLRTQLGVLARDGLWTYASAVMIRPDGTLLELVPADPALGDLQSLLGGCWVPAGASNVVVSRELLDRVGGFDETLAFFTDWDLWIRLAALAEPAVSSEILVAYVEHAGNVSVVRPTGSRTAAQALRRKHRLLLGRHGVDIDVVGASRYVAERLLRDGRRAAAARELLRSAVLNGRAREAVLAALTVCGSARLVDMMPRVPPPPSASVRWVAEQCGHVPPQAPTGAESGAPTRATAPSGRVEVDR
jgi:glycosyltransferase involved in cell wall biosynthesis